MILIFFGPPGAGKGTQANLLSNHFNIPHLSTGEILRNKLTQEDDLSEQLRKVMGGGELVSDDLLNKIIFKRIVEKDCINGFILDGYPRTMNQAIFFNSILTKNKISISKIIQIEVEQNTIIKRIISRSNIENRGDDKEEVIKTRIKKYKSETQPLCNFYKKLYPDAYKVIDGNQEISNINEDILKIFKND